MVFFNWATMQMAAKIVYYGPGLCGKTTNLSFIYAKTAPGSRGEMVSLETETDRTLFFDLLPLEVGKVGGFKTRLQLYTVPGQVFYNTTRKLVLKGVDGVVFVTDSQRPMADANVESFQNLATNLRELGLSIETIPLVLQYNKRDLKNTLSVEELNDILNKDRRWDAFESVAVDGPGVFETLKAVTRLTLKSLRRRMATQDATGAPVPAAPATPRGQVVFSPTALSAAAAEGLGTPAPASPPVQPPVETAPEVPPPQPISELPVAAALEAAAPAVESVPSQEPAVEVPEVAAPIEAAEEVEEAPVEFATTAEAVEPAEVAVEAGMRHVKLGSSLDILAELETLRKSSTFKAEARQSPASRPGFDLDALLQGSLNSRQEAKRRIDENVGTALSRASRCLVKITLVDDKGSPLKDISPVEVELKQGERIRQLALTLIVNLQAD
jgi:hypothetical protein